MRLGIALAIAAAVCGSFACTDEPSDSELTPVGTSGTAAATSKAHPRSTRTGWPEVDEILGFVDANDAEGLRRLFLERSIGCKDGPSGAPAPPPCDGHPQGTTLPVFPFAPCGEGTYVPPSGESDLVRQLLAGSPAPFAVTMQDPGTDRAYGPAYSLFFATSGETLRVVDLNVRGRIVSLHFACHRQPFDQVLPLHVAGLVQYILPPPASSAAAIPPPTPTPTPVVPPLPMHPHQTRTGVHELDTVLDALFPRDVDRLRDLVRLSPVACVIDPRGIGAPPACPAGSPEGTLVPAVTGGGCEGHYITEDDLLRVLAVFPGETDFGLYAVLQRRDGGYVLVLSVRYGANRPTAAALTLDADGLITHFDGGCGEPLGERHIRPDSVFVLPPP